jgi:hypothetical protein
MAPSSSPVSSRLRRAALAEREQLARRRERAERERDGVRATLERVESDLAEIDERLALLGRLALPEREPEPSSDDRPAPSTGAARVLEGPAIRTTAVRLLVEHEPAREEVHYRDWYALLTKHGFAVAGQKPLAVFLSQVSRSPVMRKATPAGVYALDRDATERLGRELSVLEAELHTLMRQSPSRPANGATQTRRRELLLAIGRHERALDEARRGLAPADHAAPDPASQRP